MGRLQLLCTLVTVFVLAPMVARSQSSDPRLVEWDRRLGALRGEHKLPGLAAAVVIDHKPTWSKGYGFADADAEVAVTPDTPFWIASVTKTFIGLLFLQLEAEGKISLDDRIADVPDWADFCAWFSTSGLIFGRDMHCDAPITIRNILNHTSNGEPGTRFFYNPMMYSRLSRYIGIQIRRFRGRRRRSPKQDGAAHAKRTFSRPAGMTRTMSSQWQREKALVFFDMASGFGVDESGDVIKRPRARNASSRAGRVSSRRSTIS